MEAIQKQQKNSIEIVKQLYLGSQDKAIGRMLDIVSQTYSGVELTPGLVSFWKEALKELSPQQIRDGLLAYMKSERGTFKPTPADIIGHAPEATDKPRKTFKKDCPDCNGTGWRLVEIDMKPTDVFYKPGKKRKGVKDCFCVRVEYDGQSFKPEQKALPPAPEIEPEELLQRIGKKTGVTLEKEFPKRDEQSEADYNRRQSELRQQAEKPKAGIP